MTMTSRRNNTPTEENNREVDKSLNPVREEMSIPSTSSQSIPSSSQNTSENWNSAENESNEQTASQKKQFRVSFKGNKKKYQGENNDSCSIFEAFKSIPDVWGKIEENKGKMMLVHGKMGRENGYVNLGMPLKCVPKDSHFEISFTQSKRHKKHGTEQLRQYDHKGGECIKFYVFAIGKEAKIIVKCPDLRREQYKLCVYAFKGESIEDALNRDGRFLTFPEEWNVIETVHYHLQKTFLVDDLEGREFQVEKHRRVSPRGAASQSCELEQTESDMLKQILDKYPSLRREGEKIRKKFNQEKKEKNISRMSTLFKTHRKNLEQLTQDSVPVEVHKLLGHLSDSVGYMFLKNNGISQGVTCFLLRDHYILTCCHMINLLVGINVESTMWAEAISKQAWVTFADKDIDSDSVKKWSIDPEFGVFNKDLDYAMLRLKKNDIPLPKGLQNKCTSPPLNGLLYIIGYPDKQRKVTDPCYVIPQTHQEQSDPPEMTHVHMFTPRSFSNVGSRDISFCFRYSGSPIFNADLELVAMHTANFAYDKKTGYSITEFGPFSRIFIDL